MRIGSSILALCAAVVFTASEGLAQDARTGGPFVPSPQQVVEAMLELVDVTADDFVVDLGSGDGRIVLTAATRHGASGVGVDIDEELVAKANVEAERLGVSDRVRFVHQDALQADVSRATVVTLYLLPRFMEQLRPKLLRELRPGTRVVSHNFHFGDEWPPDRTVPIEVENEFDPSGDLWPATIYIWTVPAAEAAETSGGHERPGA